MRNRTSIFVLFALAGAAACGGVSETDFSATPGTGGGKASGGSGGKQATGGSSGTTATGGSAQQGGSGGTATGGSSTTGGSGGSSTTGGSATGGSSTTGGSGGSAGDAMGGTGAVGGSGTGGSDTGGSATTGGTAGSSGSAGGSETGGSATTGGSAGSGLGGSAGSATAGTGGSAGSGMNPDCTALQTEYESTLQGALACNARSGKDQCTLSVKSNLTCGCPVFVNPANEDAVAKLEELRKAAGTHCVTPCPAIACVGPESGTCTAGKADMPDRCTSVRAGPL